LSRKAARGDPTDKLEYVYYIDQVTDEAGVAATCASSIPTTDSNGLRLEKYEIDERINYGLHRDKDVWRVLATYRDPSFAIPVGTIPSPRFTFDTTGGTAHKTQARKTVGIYGDKASKNLKGAIGFDGKNIEGVDITVPVFKFSETYYMTDAEVDEAYKQVVFRATGTVNSDAFRGFEPGEVLFLGAVGARQGSKADDLWEITYNWAAMPNENNATVGEIGVGYLTSSVTGGTANKATTPVAAEFTGIAKEGWHYLWVQYADTDDGDVNSVVKTPIAVYVEQVYPYSDFSDLTTETGP
jgi:hypothetical protein